MKSCLIVASGPITDYNALKRYVTDDQFIICADGGIEHARALDLMPNLVIGDFDSWGCVEDTQTETLCYLPEKDDTDTMLAVKEAITRGYRDITVLASLGGRMDHTLANIAAMKYAAKYNAKVMLADSQNEITLLSGGAAAIPRREGYFISLVAYSERVTGVSIQGVKYPLQNTVLDYSFPLGISNEWTADQAEITALSGDLLIIIAKD